MANREILKLAVIGGGHIAQQHLAVLADLPQAEVATLVDPHAQTLQETADRFAIPQRLSSHTDLLEKDPPDAVFVLVSVLQVPEVAAACIRAGIPTFLEKPPGLYTVQTRQLADLARQHHTLTMVGVNRRFYSTLLRGRERLLEVGPVRSILIEAHEDLQRIRENPKFPDEVVQRWSAANGIHALDLLRFFAGDVGHIAATHHLVEGPMPDCCTASIKFSGGAIGRALMDWFAPGGHRFEVRGTGTTLTGDAGYYSLTLQQRGAAQVIIEADEIDRRYKAGFYRQDETFLECVRHGKPLPFPACDLDDAVKTMEMIDAIVGTGKKEDARTNTAEKS